MIITKIDDKTGETLLWCGEKSFSILETQKELNRFGYVLQKIKEDKWGILSYTNLKENKNGG